MSAHVEPIVDAGELRDQIRAMYREVAEQPDGEFHFELGRPVAERLGYPREWLDAVPPDALASFAGVGHMLDLAAIESGDTVLDLGSGSGTDAFVAAHLTGPTGRVIGVDMTDAQLAKARRLRDGLGLHHVRFVEGLIEAPPVDSGSVDVVISNGVVNLAPDKDAVFGAAARALRPGGRLAIADIVSARELIERTRRNVALWAACIAGAVPQEDYLGAIEAAGLRVETVRDNRYRFLSPRALAAADKYGVTSVTVLATKPEDARSSR
jgi:SAM-dependent methyltransferase